MSGPSHYLPPLPDDHIYRAIFTAIVPIIKDLSHPYHWSDQGDGIMVKPEAAAGDGEWSMWIKDAQLIIGWNQYGRADRGGIRCKFWGDTRIRIRIDLSNPNFFEEIKGALQLEKWERKEWAGT